MTDGHGTVLSVSHVVWAEWPDLAIPDGVELISTGLADLTEAELGRITFYVPPYLSGRRGLEPTRRMPNLKVLQVPNAGYDDAIEYLRPGVTLCNARGVHDESTAELAVALALASRRGFARFGAAQREGLWRRSIEPSLTDSRIAVVGPATGRAVTSAGWTVGFQPDSESSAVTLAAQWCASHDAQAEGRVLILRSDLAGAHLSDELQAHGFTVDIGIAYRTVGIDLDPAVVRELREGAIDIVLLTSLSVARELRRQIGPLPDRVRVASIGPGTTRDAEHIGFTVAHTATTQSVDELLAELDAARPSDASPLRDDPRDRRDAHTSHDQETRA